MKIEHADARILREALAHCANYGSGTLRQRALASLKQYAINLRPYCEHIDKADVRGLLVCIDCGMGTKKNGN